jgi:phage terminase small subunit
MPGNSSSGRRPTPTRCLELVGSPHAKKRKGEPDIVPVLSVTPSPDYTDREKEIFICYSQILIAMKILAPGDLAVLDCFTRIYAAIQELELDIRLNGRSYDGGNGLRKTRPEVNILSDHRKDLKGYVSLLGLAPSARAGVTMIKDSGRPVNRWAIK